MRPSTQSISSLAPGDRFRLPFPGGRAGTLIRLAPGSASVRYDGTTEVVMTPTRGANAGKEVTFSRPAEATQISLGTEVLPI